MFSPCERRSARRDVVSELQATSSVQVVRLVQLEGVGSQRRSLRRFFSVIGAPDGSLRSVSTMPELPPFDAVIPGSHPSQSQKPIESPLLS